MAEPPRRWRRVGAVTGRPTAHMPASHGAVSHGGFGTSLGSIQRFWVSVLPCEPSDDSPSVPSCRSPCASWATWPPTCGGPGTPRPRTSSRPSTPRSGATAATTRSRRWAPSPTARLDELAGDKRFLRRLSSWRTPTSSSTSPATAGSRRRRPTPRRLPRAIAYFSPEYGITSVLPQYSGGLGILAGDHLKTASDLGVPLIGVGLLYQYGYFRQQFSREGWQQESYPVLDPDGLPITLLREDDGTPAQVRLAVPGDQRARRAGLRGAGRPRAAAAPRHRRRGEPAAACARSPTGSTAAPPSTACSRSCCSASAASARSACTARASPAPRCPRCSTPTRATPASSASSGSASSPWPRTAPRSTSTPRSRSPAPAPCSPRTPRSRPASTASPAS